MPGVGERRIAGTGVILTVTARGVVAVKAPDVPVIVNVAFPTVSVLLAVKVSTLESVEVGFGAKVAVTPAGSPDATRFTLPLNPYWGVT